MEDMEYLEQTDDSVQRALTYVKKYIKLYPDDKLTLIGGAAAYLHIQKCDINITVNDLDVDIWTNFKGNVILDRWLSILPKTFKATYESDYPITLFTLSDESGENLTFDIFVNEKYIVRAEKICSFPVVPLSDLIYQYYNDLISLKEDIDLIQSGIINWDKKLLHSMIHKYDRYVERLKLLANCYRQQ